MKVKVLFLGALVAILFNGCGFIDRKVSSITGNGSETCQDGVVYLQFTSGVTVKYNQDGTIVKCSK